MISVTPLQKLSDLDSPRRVLRYVLVWCSQGTLTLRVDEGEFQLRRNQVLTITSGQIHHIVRNHKAKGFILEFTYDFFCKNDSDIELIFHNSLFCHFAMNEVIDLQQSEVLASELNRVSDELRSMPYQYLISVHSRIELILIEINRQKLRSGGDVYKPDALFLKFLEIVRANFSKNISARKAAALLRTTESKLNELSKLHTGKTAQNVIYSLVASEAKRLFTHEKLSVKETAFALGFKDPFYFSNFFKKQTQISPKAYREKFLTD